MTAVIGWRDPWGCGIASDVGMLLGDQMVKADKKFARIGDGFVGVAGTAVACQKVLSLANKASVKKRAANALGFAEMVANHDVWEGEDSLDVMVVSLSGIYLVENGAVHLLREAEHGIGAGGVLVLAAFRAAMANAPIGPHAAEESAELAIRIAAGIAPGAVHDEYDSDVCRP